MKIKWPVFFATLFICLSILACNLPSAQDVNAAATAIALTFEAQTAQASVAQPSATFTQIALASSTAAPSSTPILPTATPSGTYFVTTAGANCRSGPGQAYKVLTTIQAGTYIILVGRNNDNSWWYVQVNPSLDCWISNTVGYTTGNPGGVPIVAAPPLPTSTLPPAAVITLPPAAIDNTPPAITDVNPLSSPVYYFNNGCGTHQVEIGARINDPTGVSDAYVKYHYKNASGTYIGTDHIQAITDQAMGGQYGFSFYTNSELSGDNGNIIYEVIAKDGAGNIGSSGSYHIPVNYCP